MVASEWNHAVAAIAGSLRVVRFALVGVWRNLAAIWSLAPHEIPDHAESPFGCVGDGKQATSWVSGHQLIKLAAAEDRLAIECLQREVELCRRWWADPTYGPYFVQPLEVTVVADGGVRASYGLPEGLFSGEEIHSRYPAGLEPRHLAWMFKRVLEVLGFIHQQGWVHTAVTPRHLWFHTGGHGLRLGGLEHATPRGRPIRRLQIEHHDWLEAEDRSTARPATDIALAARTMQTLAGGESASQRWPASVPAPMQRFFDACMLESPRMRPGDAWALHEEFDELLERLFGAPQFVPLLM